MPLSPSSSRNHAITSLYSSFLGPHPLLLSLTWCSSLLGQGFCLGFQLLPPPHPSSSSSSSSSSPSPVQRFKVDLKPWRLFRKKYGSQTFDVQIGDDAETTKTKCVEIAWNLASARYAGGPEPRESFYLLITCDGVVVLALGDMQEEALRKNKTMAMVGEAQMDSKAAMVSRKEYVYGKQEYRTETQLCKGGKQHSISISIECRDGALSVRVDKKVVLDIIGSLMWKFRGNQIVDIDGLPVHVYWDVHDWLFRPNSGHAAVFMFHSSSPSSSSIAHHHHHDSSTELNLASPLSQDHQHGFSLLLYAVNNDKTS